MRSILFGIALLLANLCISGLHAQETVATSGSTLSGTGGTVSYSLGQTVYSVIGGSTGSVAQGVQQPYEISVITASGNRSKTQLEVSVYPNPASLTLNVQSELLVPGGLRLCIYDLNGRCLLDKPLTNNHTVLDIQNLSPAAYLVKVFRNSNEITVFKVLKK